MAVSISTLKASLVLDTSQWRAGFASASKSAQGFASGIAGKVMGHISGLGAGLVAAGVAATTSAITFNNLFESLREVGKLSSTSKQLGITVESTQRLAFAASKAGIDLDTMANGLLLMGKNIGSGGKSLDKRFLDVADAFVKINDAGKRAAFARQVFGRGGFEFINLLAKGSVGIRQSADAIDKFGLAIKDIDAQKAKDALIAMRELGEVAGAFKNKLAIEIAPSLTTFFKGQLELLSQLLNKWKELKEFNQIATAGHPINQALQKGAIEGLIKSHPLGAALMLLFGRGGTPSAAGANVQSAIGQGGPAAGLKTIFPQALARGTVEAASAITKAGGNPIAEANKPIVDKLTLIERHTAAAARAKSDMPLRASRLRGGGL